MPVEPVDLHTLVATEQFNPRTEDIDRLSTAEVLHRINADDQQVPLAVAKAIPQITQVVDRVVAAFRDGGRLFYVGAGTSGRLGVLDASECPPTFSVSPDLVCGIIAGGDVALRHAVEGAEDSAEEGARVIQTYGITARDVVIGLSASGGAAYVVAAIKAARQQGAFTGAITCYANGELAKTADVAMVAEVGPEVIAGSTRMKAGTAQKLILNMISTAAMVQWGKTYGNLMVDLKSSNKKLRQRALRLVCHLAQTTPELAQAALDQAQGRVKPGVVMLRLGVSYETALEQLARHQDKLRLLLEEGSVL